MSFVKALNPGTRLPWLVALCLCALLGQRGWAADEVPFPGPIAFNRGAYTKDALNDAVKRKVAEAAIDDTSKTMVRHLRIEVFENSKVAAKAQTTLFALCESTFSVTLNSGRQLSRVTVEYVILDSSGKPVGKRTARIEYSEEVGKDKKLVWNRKEADGSDLDKFHKNLPPWAKEKLWQTSGFLSLNPGQPPVAFQKSDKEVAVGLLGEIMDLAPGVAKKALTAVLENALKKLTREALADAVKQDEARWGTGADLDNEKAVKNAQAYVNEGKTIWAK